MLALLAAGAYFLAFRLNELLNPWVLYGQGIALVFLPAGVRHVSMLLARGWGALGCFVALFWLALEFWSGQAWSVVLSYSMVSTGVSWAGIEMGKRLLGIGHDLLTLRFWHLPLLDLLATGLHGVVVNGFFYWVGMKQDGFWANALAMMTGDFVGSFLLLMGLWLGLSWRRSHQTGVPQP